MKPDRCMQCITNKNIYGGSERNIKDGFKGGRKKWLLVLTLGVIVGVNA